MEQSSGTPNKSRPLSRHERYSLVRRHIGSPSVLTYIITFGKDAQHIPSLESLQKRMHLLVKRYPILSSRVGRSWTSKPVLERIDLSDEAISQRIKSKTIQAEEGFPSSEAIFEECLSWGISRDPDTGDLWRVGRFLNETTQDVSIVFSVDHLLGDGRGSLNLLPLLVSPDPDVTSSTSSLPPALEDRVDVRPAISTVLKAILQALVVPKLPTWMVPAFFLPKPFWPYLSSHADTSTSFHKQVLPLEAPVGVLVAGWNADEAAQLAATFSQRGAATSIQGMIAACCMGALWMTEKIGETAGHTDSSGFNIKTTTPTSERSKSLGHPDILGNYVGAVDSEAVINSASDLIQLAKQYNMEIKQAKASKSPPRAFGLLDYIDDPEVTNESRSELTGWDKFFVEKASSKTPYGSSIEISNLGLAPPLDAELQSEVKSIDWIQTSTAGGAAININVLGGQPTESGSRYGDLRFSITWRKDSAPSGRLSDERVKEFRRVLRRLPSVIRKLEEEGSPLTLSAIRQNL
ncbi:hypothetical protein P389DRAFT_175226 [Cystobasidium minutum MCA 4210]|uniref:uncharacterized protein n=1 Tax=Cystobasidium minutum MCA 4210 TaxID=1397322 RepID=UPI0034CD4B36|eukprot:jgi/Rhomi1/175226/fgenesh1_kg.9_\